MPESIVNVRRYAPVQFENLHDSESNTPVGRIRVANDDEDVSPLEIPHEHCEHVFAHGFPRRGKDTNITSLATALHEDHGYSYISVGDDGRMNRALAAVPATEHEESLDKFDQAPEGLDLTVYVPDCEETPDRLPANFERFKFSAETVAQYDGPDVLDGLECVTGFGNGIDMESVIEDGAATLCTGFFGPESAAKKYSIIALWLNELYAAKDSNPRLPRVALSVHDIERLAPSRVEEVSEKESMKKAVKWVREALFKLAVQGGSRRIMLLASATRDTDVYGGVRKNFPTLLIHQLGCEETEQTRRLYGFSAEQAKTLRQLDFGHVAVLSKGRLNGPVEMRPSKCAIEGADHHWLDRYGEAVGARVFNSLTFDADGSEWWVHVPGATVHDISSPPTADGDGYASWFLLESDFDADVDRGDVDGDLVDKVLASRREHDLSTNIMVQ